MNLADATLQEARRPFYSPRLWGPLLLISVACVGIAYEGYQVAKAIERSVTSSAAAQGRATSNAILGLIEREHERLDAFVLEKEEAVRAVLARPDDWTAVETLQASLRRMFRGAIAFSITAPDGRPLFEDFDGLVGPVCQAEMRDYARAIGEGRDDMAIPPIHPVPGAYHFDLISQLPMSGGNAGLFFVSVSPARIAEILASAEQASGSRVLLVNRNDPSLIEVSSVGSRDALAGEFRLSEEALTLGHFIIDLPRTHWRLVVLPDADILASAMQGVYLTVGTLILVLLLISAVMLYLIRRFEQRNSSLFMRSLQTSVSRQRAILQSMVDGMVMIDSRGTIHHVNNAITQLFGYQPSELMERNVKVLMPEPDQSAHDEYLQNYLTTGESKILGKGREVLARRKDGTLFPILLTLGESIEGEERMFVGILHDMTAYNEAQRKIVAQALEIQRSNQELDELTQIASKNLQTPLLRIASLGEALGTHHDTTLSGTEKAQLKSLSDEARDMSELVKGLADYTRSGHDVVAQSVNLDAVIQDVKKDLADLIVATGAEVVVRPLGAVNCDPKQLRQLFWNLIENALKFRDSARSPKIDVMLGEGSRESSEYLTVLVKDNGMGIPENETDRVFEAFHRLHPRNTYPGAGLGLSFCRKIIESAGGSITVTSIVGEGSVFRVVLPLARD